MFVAELEIEVLGVLSFPLPASPWSLHTCVCSPEEMSLCGASVEKQVVIPQAFSTFAGWKRREERVMKERHCFSSQPRDVSHKMTSQRHVSIVLNIFSSVSENKSLSKGHSRQSSEMPESDSKIYQIAVLNKFKLSARALDCLIIDLFFAI